MSNSEGLELERKATTDNDMETGTPVAATTTTTREEGTGFGAGNVLRRWRRDDFIRKGSLGLRAFGLVFSALSFIIMASNIHGGLRFGDFEEYRYLLAIAILATLYTGLQCFRHIHQLSTGNELVPKTSALIDFVGDQIMAYLLLSSASSAIPITNRMREGGDNIFTDSAAAAISMSLLAFISLATSSVIAGYKLSTQSSI